MRSLGPILAAFQDALAWEYAPAIQYTRHAGLFDERGKRFKFMRRVAKELHKHAMEEMHHAQILSYWIPLLGVSLVGHPAVPEAEARPVTGDIWGPGSRLNYRKMLEEDLRGEVAAIDRYLGIREQVERGLWPGARKPILKDLDQILKTEREHERDLREWLSEMGL